MRYVALLPRSVRELYCQTTYNLKYLKFELTDLHGKLQYVVYKMTVASEIMLQSKL